MFFCCFVSRFLCLLWWFQFKAFLYTRPSVRPSSSTLYGCWCSPHSPQYCSGWWFRFDGDHAFGTLP
uniref:Putative secreted protein n=1 Tax=Anopheles marajoara TaxID=58244 RepID=A0A2M4CFQ6_9DIPT